MLSKSYTVANCFETYIYAKDYTSKSAIPESNKKWGESIILITLGCPCTITFERRKKDDEDEGEHDVVLRPRSILVMRGECRRKWKFHVTQVDEFANKLLHTITLKTSKLFDEEMLRRRCVIEPNDRVAREIVMRLKTLKGSRYSGNSGDTSTPSQDEMNRSIEEADYWRNNYADQINFTFNPTMLNFPVTP